MISTVKEHEWFGGLSCVGIFRGFGIKGSRWGSNSLSSQNSNVVVDVAGGNLGRYKVGGSKLVEEKEKK